MASRATIGLADVVPGILARADEMVVLDVDDTVKPVFGAAKQGAESRIHTRQGPERAAGHDQH